MSCGSFGRLTEHPDYTETLSGRQTVVSVNPLILQLSFAFCCCTFSSGHA